MLPHIHSGISGSTLHWKKTLSLLPLLGVCLWQTGLNGLGIIAASVSGGIAGEAISEILLKKKLKFSDGSSVLSGLLLAFLMPSSISYGMAALGSFFAVIVGREIFGGLGTSPFSPALAGRIFLEVAAPSIFLYRTALFENSWFVGFALMAGAIFLVSQKLIFWELPAFFAAGFFIVSLPFNREVSFDSATLLFSAVFLIADSSVPVSSKGRKIFAGASGALVFLFGKTGMPAPFAQAFLMTSTLSAWLDRIPAKPLRSR